MGKRLLLHNGYGFADPLGLTKMVPRKALARSHKSARLASAPITPASLHEAVHGVLKKWDTFPDSTIELLVERLEYLRANVCIARSHPPDGGQALDALNALNKFFHHRVRQVRLEASTLGDRAGKRLLANELKLERHFRSFLNAMINHEWSLSEDADLITRTHETWHDVAAIVAGVFEEAMTSLMPQKMGRSADGPTVKFTAAVMPLVTGEVVSPSAVAKYLQRCASAVSATRDVRKK